ncbi:hypothetical protein, partial [Methanoculleus sp.]|uniref:hypothetical protein n=1 Tax=Methanoculleus sp. TaxID=90427 RepID=UPI002D1FAC5D
MRRTAGLPLQPRRRIRAGSRSPFIRPASIDHGPGLILFRNAWHTGLPWISQSVLSGVWGSSPSPRTTIAAPCEGYRPVRYRITS